MKIRGLLIFTLILFVSCGVVTAADVNDCTSSNDLDESTVEPMFNQFSNENMLKEDNINEKIMADNTPENNTISKKESDLYDNVKSSAATFTLTDENWDDYFANDGSIKEDVVSEGNVLLFNGEFTDRFMMITVPVNITSGPEQAVLTDCLFYVTSSNTNITGLNINNTDYDEYVIYLEDVSNVIIENNKISMTNNDDGITTHTIDIYDSDNILIRNNEIYTAGPEENLNYRTGDCVTLSINADNSNNISIDQNNITTGDNGITGRYGTIYSILLKGSSLNEMVTGGRITNNIINTRGKYYMYGLSLLFAEDYLIEKNEITTISNEYANGIQLEVVTGGLVNNNTVYTRANNFTYPIYCAGRVAREMIYSTDNLFSNNTCYAESITTYLYEFFLVKYSTISFNNLSANVGYGTGIGTSQSGHNTFEYNNINITFSMKNHVPNPDAIPDSPTGITVTTIQEQVGVNNTIRYNNVTVTSPETESIPSINLISKNNTVYRNYLISSQGVADEAVNYTMPNDVHDNYPAKTKNVTIPLEDIVMYTNTTETVTITVIDEDNIPVNEGKIEILIDEELKEEYTLTDQAFTYNLTDLKAGIYTLTVNYIPADDMKYNSATNSSTITVNKIGTRITINDIDTLCYDDPLNISGKIMTAKMEKIKTELKITVNDKEYTTESDDNGEYNFTTTIRSVGLNNITVSFAGDEIYNPSNMTTSVTTNKQDLVISVDSIDDVRYGDNVTITGKFTDKNGKAITNSNINVYINAKQYKVRTDKTGIYTLYAPVKAIGTNNVTINYGGNTVYNSYETNTTFNAEKQDLLITYEEIQNVKYNDNITITGKFTDANGKAITKSNVNIYINNKQYKAKTDNTGIYTLTAPVKAIGTNNVTINYGGNTVYNSYETNTTFNAEKQDLLITYEEIQNVKYNDNITITGKFTDANGKAITKSNVNIYINNKQYKAKTDNTGIYTLTAPVKAIGTNNITLSYGGNTVYNSYETSTTFNAEKQDLLITVDPISDVKCGDNVTITGRFTDKNGKAISNSNVNVYINGKQYKARTDSTGAFKLDAPTSVEGINNVTLSYGGNTYYNSYETSTTFNVIAKND